MIKLLVLTRRAASISKEAYQAYWTTRWRDLACNLPNLRHYRQCIAAGVDAAPFGVVSKFDGLDEYWFDNITAARAAKPALDEMLGANEVASNILLRMAVREHVIMPGFAMRPGQDGKLTYFWKHRADITAQAALDHWYTCHAPLVPGTPGVIRHVQGHPLSSSFEVDPPFWTGVSELWMRSLDVLPQFMSAPQMAEQGIDGRLFSDPNFVEIFVTIRECIVM